MKQPWQIRIYEKQQVVFSDEGPGPLELGRQNPGEPGPYCTQYETGRRRIVVARLNEDTVSRQHALVEPLDGEKIRVSNLSKKLPVRLGDGGNLKPGESCELPLPALFLLGHRTIRVQVPESEEVSLQALPEATVPPGSARVVPVVATLAVSPAARPEGEAVIRWLQAAAGVLQSAAGSSDFFLQAARAIVELVGLDSGRVLLCEGGTWRVEALYPENASGENWQASRKVLARLQEEKRTFWQLHSQVEAVEASLIGVKAVVAAPILDRGGQVIGALYGDRRRQGDRGAPISRLEAILVELLASGVAAGLARVEQERAAAAARVQFEQFFTPELAGHLAARPDLLEGRDTEITTLFCDIRGFSRVSDRLGPAKTINWLRDVLNVLSDCVLEYQGVLVDYTGDEVMALWGAPEKQPEHARTACRAALAMLECLPGLSERWRELLQERVDLGIGINTGQAHVGNVGSDRKFKYGALGTTVNLGSRVQGATKYLRCRLLVTGATHAQLGSGFASRRLCKIKVVNIPAPVELYEVVPSAKPGWAGLKQAYEDGLELFEKQDFRQATRVLGNLLAEHPGDGPSLVLLSRAVNYLVEESAEFNPVWELPGK